LVGAWEQPAISSPSLLAPSFRARVLEVVGALERSGSGQINLSTIPSLLEIVYCLSLAALSPSCEY
jgi:hypothetical protein